MAVMIPAKAHCPSNWTLEYNGYIMSPANSHYSSMYECVDKNPESVPGLNSYSDPRALFYPVEAKCNGFTPILLQALCTCMCSDAHCT